MKQLCILATLALMTMGTLAQEVQPAAQPGRGIRAQRGEQRQMTPEERTARREQMMKERIQREAGDKKLTDEELKAKMDEMAAQREKMLKERQAMQDMTPEERTKRREQMLKERLQREAGDKKLTDEELKAKMDEMAAQREKMRQERQNRQGGERRGRTRGAPQAE